MKRVLLLAKTNTVNIGDKTSSVESNWSLLKSFLLESEDNENFVKTEVIFRDFLNVKSMSILEQFDGICIGGGGLLGPAIFNDVWDTLFEYKGKVLLFGVGHNFHYDQYQNHLLIRRILKKEEAGDWLIFGRCGCFAKYTYCPSFLSISKAFAKVNADIEWHEVGYYEHLDYLFAEESIKRVSNNSIENIDQIVDFLSHSRRVITSSYHGAIWAKSLGCEVEIRNRYSDKFNCLNLDRFLLTDNIEKNLNMISLQIKEDFAPSIEFLLNT